MSDITNDDKFVSNKLQIDQTQTEQTQTNCEQTQTNREQTQTEQTQTNSEQTQIKQTSLTINLDDDIALHSNKNHQIVNESINSLFARKKKEKHKQEKKYIPFIEKYRPKKFEDLILPVSMQYKIANIIESNILPNIIITGSPGTGKTSTILCLAKKILGKNYKDLLLELNASNNRTLDFINSTVAYFCKRKLSSDTSQQKLIIFDEADNITKKAQNLLANLMEEHSHNTRFAFTCNESNKIIESIHSRCMILRYVPMTAENIKNRLEYICNNEKIEFDNGGINALNFMSQGDIRQAINNLEATYHGYKTITEENVFKLCYHPHPKIIVEIIKECVNSNLMRAIEYIYELKNAGYCINDILLTLLNSLREVTIDEDIRINFIKIISDCYINVSDGIDSNLQLFGCLSRMIKYIDATSENS
jgi:replication factor C subunit 2/4